MGLGSAPAQRPSPGSDDAESALGGPGGIRPLAPAQYLALLSQDLRRVGDFRVRGELIEEAQAPFQGRERPSSGHEVVHNTVEVLRGEAVVFPHLRDQTRAEDRGKQAVAVREL